MITIDARTLTSGINYNTFFADYYQGLEAGASVYHGGEPDAAYGSSYYVSGPQVSFTYGEDADQMVLLEGDEIAYDFIHHGPQYGHGISGDIDTAIFGYADDGTGTQDGTENGLVTGLDVGLVISGLSTTADPGEGSTHDNAVYRLYDAVRNGLNGDEGEDLIADLYDIFDDGGQQFLGSDFNDVFTGTDEDDIASGFVGRDNFRGGGGNDLLEGGDGQDTLRGGKNGDTLDGGNGNDRLLGGNGNDHIEGGDGDDLLIGGRNLDRLFGGEGEDVFAYLAASDSEAATADRIVDFESGVDTIDLSALGSLTLVDDFSGAGNEVQIEEVGRRDYIEVDFDGDSAADFAVIVRLGGVADDDLLLA